MFKRKVGQTCANNLKANGMSARRAITKQSFISPRLVVQKIMRTSLAVTRIWRIACCLLQKCLISLVTKNSSVLLDVIILKKSETLKFTETAQHVS